MISRLTTFAAIFAVITTASFTFAVGSQGHALLAPVVPAVTKQMPVVHLEPVVITVNRQPR